jgi:homoserine O-succinyltransferase
MPVAVEGGRVPALLARAMALDSARSSGRSHSGTTPLRIALVNNMPDAAIEDTECQFFDLLSAAATETHISLSLFSLPNLPRNESGQQHLDNFYLRFDSLLNSQFDGVIVTGTEPRRPDLREEPYWQALVELLKWAEAGTTSTVLSCLAAHAGVLACDGIPRSPLAGKRFGVFQHAKVSAHPLTAGTADLIHIPHSRWNDLNAEALISHAYQIVTRSSEAGVDLFVKPRGKSLFVHFQGHPEYSDRTLLKEYRRDVKRFLRRERETYPSMPKAYFDPAASALLDAFQKKANSETREDLLSEFPDAALTDALQNSWRASAAGIYRNWIQFLVSKQKNAAPRPALAPVIRG